MAAASNHPFLPDGALRSPDRLASQVQDSAQAAYERFLAAYRDARRDHPTDDGLAIAQCNFILHFAWQDDLSWGDVASKDFDACQSMLEKQFSSSPDAVLFVLEHRFGKGAIAYGEPLVARSARWTPTQRARLHAALSRAYAVSKNEKRGGEEALLAVKLDPDSDRLVVAMRYLASTHRTSDAATLLANAPVAKTVWQEAARVNAATDVLPGPAALNELRRAQHAGLKIDAYTTARALEHAGDPTGAQAVLAKDAATLKYQTPQYRQLLLDVAFDAHNPERAADILRDEYSKTHKSFQLVSAYFRVIGLKPSLATRLDLMPLTVSALLYATFFIALPGLLFFPVHYRGTVRQRIGKISSPVFANLGLRHAWFALSAFLVAFYVIVELHSGAVSLSPTVRAALSGNWSTRVAVTHMWALLSVVIGTAWIARRLQKNEWLGRGPWRYAWLAAPIVLLGVALALNIEWMHTRAATYVTTGWSSNLVTGAKAIGGMPLAIAIVCVAVPVIEQFIFRGCLLGGLTRHLSFGWANMLQAAIFAALHHDIHRFVFLLAFGLVQGWMARETKGLGVPVLTHSATNGIYLWAFNS